MSDSAFVGCRFDIGGACTRYSERDTCCSNADPVEALLEAGASLRGRTVTEELNLG